MEDFRQADNVDRQPSACSPLLLMGQSKRPGGLGPTGWDPWSCLQAALPLHALQTQGSYPWGWYQDPPFMGPGPPSRPPPSQRHGRRLRRGTQQPIGRVGAFPICLFCRFEGLGCEGWLVARQWGIPAPPTPFSPHLPSPSQPFPPARLFPSYGPIASKPLQRRPRQAMRSQGIHPSPIFLPVSLGYPLSRRRRTQSRVPLPLLGGLQKAARQESRQRAGLPPSHRLLPPVFGTAFRGRDCSPGGALLALPASLSADLADPPRVFTQLPGSAQMAKAAPADKVTLCSS